MANCTGIFQGADFDCENPPQAGVDPRLILINFSDLDSVAKDADGNISAFTLVAGTKGFVFSGSKNSLVPEVSQENTAFSVGFIHALTFQVFDKSQISKTNMERMTRKKVIGIIQTDDRRFELWGSGAGLFATLGQLPGDTDTGGSYTIALSADEDGAKEAKLPTTIFDTDFDTTKDLIDNVANIPSITTISPLSALVAGGTAMTLVGNNFFLGGVNDVQQIDLIKTDGTIVNVPTFNVTTNIDSDFTSPAAAAGSYTVRVITSSGEAQGIGFPLIVA